MDMPAANGLTVGIMALSVSLLTPSRSDRPNHRSPRRDICRYVGGAGKLKNCSMRRI